MGLFSSLFGNDDDTKEDSDESTAYNEIYEEDSDEDEEISDPEEDHEQTPTGSRFDLNKNVDIFASQFNDDNKIFGMPYKYSQLADPFMRIYESTFEEDSYIAFINVGIPKINRSLSSKLKSLGETSSDALSSLSFGTDNRLISFKSKFGEYYKYVDASAEYLWNMLDLNGIFEWNNDFWGNAKNTGLPFFCTKNTSISEGLTNEYSEPSMVQSANSKAQETRERYVMGMSAGGSAKGASNFLDAAKSALADLVTEATSDIPIIGSVAGFFIQQNVGSMQFFGDIWASSKVSNSYTLDFRFFSPYGDKESIFYNCYFPLLLLMNMALPRQNGRFAYKEPFIVRIQFPGWFIIECGCIENLTWNKGGDEQIFNSNGLPLEITASMQVRDLYPNMMSTKRARRLKYNWGLQCFLENMAGMNINELSMASLAKRVKSDLKQFGSGIRDAITFKSLRYSVGDVWTNIGAKISGG